MTKTTTSKRKQIYRFKVQKQETVCISGIHHVLSFPLPRPVLLSSADFSSTDLSLFPGANFRSDLVVFEVNLSLDSCHSPFLS